MSTILLFKDCITIFEAVAAVTGFITWNKWKNHYFKWVPIYLLVLVFCECAGYYLGLTKNYDAVKTLYMFFVIPFEISFICWLFYRNLSARFKSLVVILWVTYFISMILDHILFDGKDYVFMSLSYTVGNAVILILVLCYFYTLLLSAGILHFKSDIMFWISAGLLIFYLGTFPYYGLYNTMAKHYMGSFISYTWVMIFLNYAMYILFTIGFICGKAK